MTELTKAIDNWADDIHPSDNLILEAARKYAAIEPKLKELVEILPDRIIRQGEKGEVPFGEEMIITDDDEGLIIAEGFDTSVIWFSFFVKAANNITAIAKDMG